MSPFSEVMPVANVVNTWQRWLSSVCKVIVLLLWITYTLIAILSAASSTVLGIATAVVYKSMTAPLVINSGFAELDAINDNVPALSLKISM